MNSLTIFTQASVPSYPKGKILIGGITVIGAIALGVLGGSPILNPTFNHLRLGLIIGSGVCGVTAIALFILARREVNLRNQIETDNSIERKNEIEVKDWLASTNHAAKMPKCVDDLSKDKIQEIIEKQPETIIKFWNSGVINQSNISLYLGSQKIMLALMALLKYLHSQDLKDVQSNEDSYSYIRIRSLYDYIFLNVRTHKDEKILLVLTTIAETLHQLDSSVNSPVTLNVLDEKQAETDTSVKSSFLYQTFLKDVILELKVDDTLKIAFFEAEVEQKRMPSYLEINWIIKGQFKLIKPTFLHLCYECPELYKWFRSQTLQNEESRDLWNRKTSKNPNEVIWVYEMTVRPFQIEEIIKNTKSVVS